MKRCSSMKQSFFLKSDPDRLQTINRPVSYPNPHHGGSSALNYNLPTLLAGQQYTRTGETILDVV